MIPRAYKIGFALALLGVFAVSAMGTQMSLATDLGYSDAQVTAACDGGGCARLVSALEASGFPRASADRVEAYALASGATVKQVLVIDWEARDARVEPSLPAGQRAHATLTLTPGAYERALAEARAIQGGQRPSQSVGTAWGLWMQSNVDVHHRPVWDDIAYKLRLSSWATSLAGRQG